MLLAVDVGNTQTVLGLYDGERLSDHWRLATERSRTGDELGVLLGGLLDPDAVDGICLATTVPSIVREWERLAERWAHAPLLVVGPGIKTGIPIRYDDPREVGPDRIVNAVAAKARYGAPAIVVDFGTSTNFDVVSPAGEYVGGVLAPGIEISMEALFARAARLVNVDFVAPESVIGKTTVAGLQSGLVYGFAGQVDGIVARDPGRARVAGGARDRDRGPRGARRPAQRGDRARRPVPHPRRAAARLGAEPVIPTPTRSLVFALASLALAVVPGPAVLYIVAQSVHGGRRAGVVSALGVSTGGMFHVAAAVIGLSAVLAASATAFTVVKLAGAAYLVWLGIRTLLSRDDRIAGRSAEPTLRRTYRQGVIVNVLNPKTALFFLAFLPQFVDPDGSTRAQLAVLGLVFVVIALTTDLIWALVAGTAGAVLRRSRTFLRVQRYVSGTIFVGLGALSCSPRRRSH